jgi:hypothetical protein
MWGWFRCKLGFHDWSAWPEPSHADCAQTRFCTRCPKKDTQVSHDWPDFAYISNHSCEQSRECRRCKGKENRTAPHEWMAWKYQRDADCGQSRECQRCAILESRVDHIWDEVWQYASPVSCVQVRPCRRCPTGWQKKQPKQGDHRWTDFHRVDCTTEQRICTHCSEKDVNHHLPGGFSRLHVYGPGKGDTETKPLGYARTAVMKSLRQAATHGLRPRSMRTCSPTMMTTSRREWMVRVKARSASAAIV